jgi:glycosyltransferase involved in cell wall biosynthesis
MRLRQIQDPIAWFVVPHVASLAGRLDERLIVYYCIDDYASMPDVDAAAVRRMDEDLTRKANVVFVASPTLLEAKRAINPETHVSPHGVDFTHFVRAQNASLPVPADAAALKHPIVGFFGLIERWIDLDLVAYLAEQRPAWSFLMIGRVAIPDAPQRPNLIYLGNRPYEVLPAYGKAFDVAVIPYRLTQQVLAANPIKLREYLAMGKPIVSVSTPEIDRFSEFVTIARSKEEFLERLDDVLARPLSEERGRRQTELASTMTWDATLQRVWVLVGAKLDTPGL